MAIKLGTPVQQVVPTPVTGIIVDLTLDKESGEIQYQVEWPADGDDSPHSRWFKESELQVLPAQGE